MRMNRQKTLACTLSMLAVALLLLVPFACLLAPVENASGLASASGAAQAAQYSYDNLYAQDTVFNNHVLSYTLSGQTGQVVDIATGDLNSDGINDVVVATSTKLTIFYGKPGGALGGSFSPALTMSEIRKIAVGDINGDGKDDIAVTYGGSAHGAGRVALFFQAEDGSTVHSSHQIATDDDPWQVVIGDFSGSGTNGLAVICRGDQSAGDVATVMILRKPYSIPYDARHIELPYGLTNLKLLAAGYVDADQRMDLVAGDAIGGTIVVLTQPTTSFSNQWTQSTRGIGGFISDLRFMDYSGSGSPRDLIVVKSGQSSDQIEIRVNSGGIPTLASSTMTISGASTVATGKVTGSTYSDLVILSNYENRARLYPGQPGGLDQNDYHEFPVNSGPIKAVTVNGGIYVLSSGNSGVIEFYRYLDSSISNADGNRLITDGQPTVVCAGSGPNGIMAAIYDGLNAVYVSDLSETGGRAITTSSVPTDLFIGDLDGDGAEDLAIAFRSSSSISIYRGSDGSFTNEPVTIPLSISQPRSMTGGSIDAIGKKVLVVGCTGGIDVIYDPLSESWSDEVIGTDNPAARIDVAIGDFGPVGSRGSIAALGNNQNFIELYYVKQSPTIGDCYDPVSSAKLTSSATFTSVAVGDLNGDGRDDIAATTASQLIVFSNAGSSEGARTYALPESSSPAQVHSADLNDDGKDDLAIRYSALAIISIWLSKGTFEFSNLYNVTAGGAASGLFLGDMNGDGRADILASSSTSSAISYWLQKDLLPSASAWLSSSTIDVNDTISFDAANSTDSFSDRASLTYQWDFGDGNTSTGKAVQHAYSVAGTYNGNLQVTDRSGLTGRADFVVRVNNPVRADFGMTKYTVTVGEEFFVWDKSEVPNHLKSISWDLGDGEVKNDINEFFYKYTRPGTYSIKLTVTDMADKVSSKERTITVLSASGTIDGIVANGGRTVFNMDEEIHFEVIVNATGLITEYSWDMDYDITTGVFNQTPGRSINQTTWTYTTPGEHTVCVRFYDLSMTQKTLTVYIINPRPVAEVTATLSKPSNFTFDASKSHDTPTDMNAGLEYRWYFDDGSAWTDWTRDPKVVHHYEVTESHVFNVTLEVRDQWGLVNSTVYKAIVDFDEPVIDLDQSMVSKAYRGEDLVIKVNVTDLTNVVHVLLIYTSNNETKTVLMSRISGTDTYVATIPAMDVTGSLSYYITAMDSDGRWAKSTVMSVTLVDRPDALWMYLVAIIGAAAGAFLLLYYHSRMIVDDVFIIYHDGNLMAHQTRRLKPGMDDQILGSMLVAIQEFVKDSFKDEASTRLNRMDFGEKKVLVEKGDHIYLAVVLHGKREGRVPQRMKEAISRAERDYMEALQEWDGDLEKVRGIKDEADPLLRPGLRDIMSSIPFLGKEDAGPVEMTVCPYCENAYPATDAKCPKCGTVPDDKAPGEADKPGRQAA
jgi:PKD repeat protein